VRTYELAFIADPDLDEAGLTALEDRIKGLVEGSEGKTLQVDRWGRRRFAYPIGRRTEGHYVFLRTEMPPSAGLAIERDLRLTEQVLRFLITQMEEPPSAAPAGSEPSMSASRPSAESAAQVRGEE
jgi:small subunit ribosomal protein S6